MDKQLETKINQKISEVEGKPEEISKLVRSLDELHSSSNSFGHGIVIGRLYNSFYYQCRRILKRDPTDEEFDEFVEILRRRQKEILGLLK